MDAFDDKRLWSRVREGDSDAFAALFDRYARSIHRYCFRRTGDHSLADDLMSVVFLEAWRRRSEVEPVRVLPWLYAIATNVLRNQQRATRRHRAALARVPVPVPEGDFADVVGARLDAERQMRSILEAVRSLSRLEQEVLALCIWEGLSSGEAAVALGVPEATVRTRLHRARAHLAASTFRQGTESQLLSCDPEGGR
jgi:RNA polymerase sigma factor (sigma-70 family)